MALLLLAVAIVGAAFIVDMEQQQLRQSLLDRKMRIDFVVAKIGTGPSFDEVFCYACKMRTVSHGEERYFI